MKIDEIVLVSYELCPYVQRVAISLDEKDVPYSRRYIDLQRKPDWFMEISPLGKVPLLKFGDDVIFESTAILEFLEETQHGELHPADPVLRAQHRGWIAYASAVLDGIAGMYAAPVEPVFAQKIELLRVKFQRLDSVLADGPWFAGETFSLVDTAFAPVFRYFDVFDNIEDFGVLDGLGKIGTWRESLARRPSVVRAVRNDYESRLWDFLIARDSFLSARAGAAEAPCR